MLVTEPVFAGVRYDDSLSMHPDDQAGTHDYYRQDSPMPVATATSFGMPSSAESRNAASADSAGWMNRPIQMPVQSAQTPAGYGMPTQSGPYPSMAQLMLPQHSRASCDSLHHVSREFGPPHGHPQQYHAGYQGHGYQMRPVQTSMYATQQNLPQNLAQQGFVLRAGTSFGADGWSMITPHMTQMHVEESNGGNVVGPLGDHVPRQGRRV